MPLNIGGSVVKDPLSKTFRYQNIVTRGLVLHLDAGTPDSYPTTGTVWSSLVGTSVGTLTNGPTYDSAAGSGSIVFDGTNDYTTIPYSANWSFGTGEFAVDMWLYLDGTQPALYSGYVGTFTTKWTSAGWVIMNSPTAPQIRFYSNDGGGLEISTSANVSLNTWYHVVLTRISNTIYLYTNSTLQSSTDATGKSVDNTSNPLLIGAGSADYGKIKMGSVKIYKGIGFTSAMVAQNYNVQKQRFGY